MFYKECIETWSLLNENNPSTTEDIVNQILWNNKFNCIGRKSVYNRNICSIGLNKDSDLYHCAGLLLFNREPLRCCLSPNDNSLLISLLDAILLEWRYLLNSSKSLIAHLTTPFETNSFYVFHRNDKTFLDKLRSY